MKYILVTGGAGYIGSHVALALLDLGERVIVLDDLSTGHKAPQGTIFIQGSIGDAELLSRLFNEYNVEAVVHLAAFISVEESVKNPEKYFKNNTENTRVLLDEVARAGVPHFIFSSTAAVYGNPTQEHVDEDAELKPVNPYGESKVRAENIIKEKGNDLTHVILRYFNVAGTDPKGRTGYKVTKTPTHLIRTAMQAVAGTRDRLNIYGSDYETKDGTCVRDYIHVADLAEAHVAALKYLRAGGKSRVYNCGYGEGYSVKEVVNMVKKVSGKDFLVVYEDRRAGDPAALIANPTRLKQELEWEPKYNDLETIIKHEIAWTNSQS